ncbi:MAG: hypothetical protein O2854_00775 [Chloroflexi bacterium]|nr:hypothetical protein [Chloroflexota bacterium]
MNKILIIAVLLLASVGATNACFWGGSSSKPIESPTAVLEDDSEPSSPTPEISTPTATLAPEPTPTVRVPPTPIPTFAIELPQLGNVNLTPFAPQDWEGPLIISSVRGERTTGEELATDANHFVSFAIANDGEDPLSLGFFVDLYIEEFPVQRFPFPGPLAAQQILTLTDWSSLREFISLAPGEQTIRLVVDPTNLIPETNENDNIVELTIVWSGEVSTEMQAVSPRAPNLVPVMLSGWDDSVVATSYPEYSAEMGPLSVNVRTYFAYSFANQGLSSIPGRVLVDLYLDDIWILRDYWSNVLAGSVIQRQPWGDVQQVLYLTPGEHTITLVLDPTNLIKETNENDNTVTRRFTWHTGAVPARNINDEQGDELAAPAELTLPNLVPGWLWQWDGPIVVASGEKTHRDSQMTTLSSVYVDVVVFNESIVEATSPFEVDFYFDDRKIHTFQMSSPTPAISFRITEDWDGILRALQIEEGSHTLKIVIDPQNLVKEANETDNIFSKTVVWRDFQEPPAQLKTYSNSQLNAMLSNLQELLDSSEPLRTPGGRDYSQDVLQVVDAGYYLITGKSLLDEDVEILLLDREEYLTWIDDTYREKFAVAEESHYSSLLRSKERDKRDSVAKKERRFGKINIVVDVSGGISDVFVSLVHEIGHMLQDMRNPAQTEAANGLSIAAIKEAQAQQFERAFWLLLQDFTGRNLLGYPAYDGYNAFIEGRVGELLQNIENSEHALGRLLQWQAILTDPNLSVLRQQLLSRGQLDARASLQLFDYLVSLPPEIATEYVNQRMESLAVNIQAIVSMAKSRLDSRIGAETEGSAAFRELKLLAP